MLEKLFGSRVRVELLKLFLSDPTKRYYVREITRLIDERINSVRRELGNLLQLEIIQETKNESEGKGKDQKKYYIANEKSMLFSELKHLITKVELIGERKMFDTLAKSARIKALYLYGTFAGDEEAPIDVFIVGTISKKSLKDFMKKLKKKSGKTLRYTVMSHEEYKFRNEITDRFLIDLSTREKITVVNKLTV